MTIDTPPMEFSSVGNSFSLFLFADPLFSHSTKHVGRVLYSGTLKMQTTQ